MSQAHNNLHRVVHLKPKMAQLEQRQALTLGINDTFCGTFDTNKRHCKSNMAGREIRITYTTVETINKTTNQDIGEPRKSSGAPTKADGLDHTVGAAGRTSSAVDGDAGIHDDVACIPQESPRHSPPRVQRKDDQNCTSLPCASAGPEIVCKGRPYSTMPYVVRSIPESERICLS